MSYKDYSKNQLGILEYFVSDVERLHGLIVNRQIRANKMYRRLLKLISLNKNIRVCYIDSVDLCFYAPEEIREDPVEYFDSIVNVLNDHYDPTSISVDKDNKCYKFTYF